MTITASMVKELRERTGAGMMDCKKALQESDGDIDAAIEAMRKSGIAKAAKKSGRTAAEGIVLIVEGDDGETTIVEVNCETDFVAKDENFLEFARQVAESIARQTPESPEALNAAGIAGSDLTVEEARMQLVAKIGENISVRRFEKVASSGDYVGIYLHGSRIGVIVNTEGGDEDLAKDIAMHIAASKPVCITPDNVPVETLEHEKEIFMARAAESGKPPEIIEKMVTGQVNKFVNEITLLGQPFVKDPDQNVGKLLESKDAKVLNFIRFEVGEGIEKKA